MGAGYVHREEQLKRLCVEPMKAHETRVPNMCENNQTKGRLRRELGKRLLPWQ